MASFVPSLRTRIPRISVYATRAATRSLNSSTRLLRQGPGTGENFEQANDPSGPKLTPNVSKTNETPVDAMGARDAPFQELVPEAEHKRQMQAPNRASTWSKSQMPRDLAMTGPRFEQTIIDAQVWESHHGTKGARLRKYTSPHHMQRSILSTSNRFAGLKVVAWPVMVAVVP